MGLLKKLFREKKKPVVSGKQRLYPKRVQAGTRFWHYQVLKDEVMELFMANGCLDIEPGVGPVVMAINEKNALRNGRKLHDEAIRKAGLGKEGVEGSIEDVL